MTEIAADEIKMNMFPEDLLSFMSDMRNFREIMPEQVEQWNASTDSCTFSISNLGNLGMQKGDFSVSGRYSFISNEQSRVKFELIFNHYDNSDGSRTGYFEIRTEMNPVIEMMAKRPLTNFVNMLTENLKQKTG